MEGKDMELAQTESIMVISLFLGYLMLWRLKKRIIVRHGGNNPEVIYEDDRPTQRFFANLSRVMSVGIVLLIVLHGSGVKDNFVLHQMAFLNNEVANFIGFTLGLFGLLLCWKAQREMGNSWRVGIDRQNRTDLITTGVFKYVRNPTYSGLFLICIGSFIIFPTVLFTLWIIVFYLSIEFQVRIEEEFLTELHGKHYTRYYQITKRYIPFLY
jgi:protein-S-isoprenylcysteine O-methyltransferase Ste14